MPLEALILTAVTGLAHNQPSQVIERKTGGKYK